MSSPSGAPTSGTPSFSTPSYFQVLRLPRAARLFGFALWARLSYGTIFLSLTLALVRATGSYTTTGACIAMFGLASALLVPARAALIDRHGMRRALSPMAVVYASLLALITVTIVTKHSAGATTLPHSTVFLLFALCTAAGATAPPLGPSMRALWAELAADPETRRRAFALDTVCEEALYLVGPLLAGALATWGAPVAGVAVSAVLVLTGTLAMVSVIPPQRLDHAGAGPQAAADETNPDTHMRPRPTCRRARLRIDALGSLVNGAYNLGSATGSAAAGLLLGGFGLRACFLLAGAPALAVALLTGIRTWRKSESGPPATAHAQDAAV
jgi:MFS family permease